MKLLYKIILIANIVAIGSTAFSAAGDTPSDATTQQIEKHVHENLIADESVESPGLTKDEMAEALVDVMKKQESVNHLRTYLRDQDVRCLAGGAAYIVVQRWLVNVFRQTFRDYKKGRNNVTPMTLAAQVGLNGYLAYKAGVGTVISCQNMTDVRQKLVVAERALVAERLALQSMLAN